MRRLREPHTRVVVLTLYLVDALAHNCGHALLLTFNDEVCVLYVCRCTYVAMCEIVCVVLWSYIFTPVYPHSSHSYKLNLIITPYPTYTHVYMQTFMQQVASVARKYYTSPAQLAIR